MEIVSVQALANTGIQQLPAEYIRPLHERPENTKAIEGVGVPVISLAQSHDVVVDQVSKACGEWGVFLITDHGIPSSLIRRLQGIGEDFFELPKEEKESYANDPVNGKFEGYGTKMTKNHDEKIEWIDYFFHMISPASKINYEIWPKNPPCYRYASVPDLSKTKNLIFVAQ